MANRSTKPSKTAWPSTNMDNWLLQMLSSLSNNQSLLSSCISHIFYRTLPSLKRNFFINNIYDGCENDAGWLCVVDDNDPCTWGHLSAMESYPVIMYSPQTTVISWNTISTGMEFIRFKINVFVSPQNLQFCSFEGKKSNIAAQSRRKYSVNLCS